MSDRLILVPPSEGKRSGGTGNWDPRSGRFATLAPQRAALIAALRTAVPEPFGLSGKRRADAAAANAALLGAPVLPAGERYNGVVFTGLDPATFTPEEHRAARERLVVVSGLGGLFAYSDDVPAYRLKMGARLADIGSVTRFWEPHLGDALAASCSPGTVVVDLLPLEHASALVRPAGVRWVRVELYDRAGRRVGHDAKAAKGRLARHLLGAEDLDAALAGFNEQGFTVKCS